MKPVVTSFFDSSSNTISYVVSDPNGNSCAIIDSVLDFDFSSGRTNTAFADEIITFVKDIINETLKILENPYNLNRVDDTIEFLKENFDLEEQDEGQDEE